MLALCGGSGGISQLAFSRGLSSGRNLDKRSFPKCRTTGLPSFFNLQVNYGTWYEHHKEDLPHIKFCGEVALRQNALRRFYLREQAVGTWVDQIPPWIPLAKFKGTCKMKMDQCTTGLRGSHGVVVRKPTEIMANHRLLLIPLDRRRRAGHHKHASVCNGELSMAAHYFKDAVSLCRCSSDRTRSFPGTP
eukprot:372474-Pyramimonas_sp.AAC.1